MPEPARAPEPPKPPKPARLVQEIKHEFSHRELEELRDKISQKLIEFNALEVEKAETASAIATQLKARWSEISELNETARAKFEMREVDCEVRLNDPTSGMKTVYRLDLPVPIRVDTMRMTNAELQMMFDFAEKVATFEKAKMDAEAKPSTEKPKGKEVQ